MIRRVHSEVAVEVIANLLQRFQWPKQYAGDYARDFAIRIVEELEDLDAGRSE